jgi:hypothetical protein
MSVPKDDHGRCSPGLLTWHSCTSTPSAMQDTLSYTREETKKAKHFVWTLPLPLALSNAINEVVSKKFQGFFTPASKQRLDYLQDDGAVKLGCAKHKVWLMATGASGTYFKCPIYDAGWREKGKGFLGEEGCVKMLHQQVVGQLQEPKIIKDLEKAAKAAPPRAPAITFKGSAKGDTKKRSRADAPAAPKAKKARRKEAEDEEEEEEEVPYCHGKRSGGGCDAGRAAGAARSAGAVVVAPAGSAGPAAGVAAATAGCFRV